VNKVLLTCVSLGRFLPGDSSCQDPENTDRTRPRASTASKICPNPRFAARPGTTGVAAVHNVAIAPTEIGRFDAPSTTSVIPSPDGLAIAS
jgi:hypothetical protein